MKKINLKSGEVVRDNKKKGPKKSLMIGVILLAVSLGIYGGVLVLKGANDSQIEKTKNEISQTKKEMDSDKYQDVYDFESRLFEIGDKMDERVKMAAFLDRISVKTMPFTHFASIKKTVDNEVGKGAVVSAQLVIYEDQGGNKVYDQEMVARQIEAFSQIEGVEKLALLGSEPGEEGMNVNVDFFLKEDFGTSN